MLDGLAFGWRTAVLTVAVIQLLLLAPALSSLLANRAANRTLAALLVVMAAIVRKIGVGAMPYPGGFLRLAEDENSDIAPRSPRVTVPVAALVGPVNSSATFSFARRAKESGLVRLFGETTGGSLRGINGGAYFFVRLPESGLEFDVPLKGNYPDRPQSDNGVEPDVRVVPTPADIAAGRDPAMAKAVEWVLAGERAIRGHYT